MVVGDNLFRIGTVPTFRAEFLAHEFASKYQPFRSSFGKLDESYAAKYGRRAFEAAAKCREAAARGDQRALHIAMQQLSLVLFQDRPNLFDKEDRRYSGRQHRSAA